MEAPSYKAIRVAEMLGIPERQLASRKGESFSGHEVWELRGKLSKFPRPLGHRKQLFLNFKGGTGKTSISTSYGYRLAEMGYRILLVDLDGKFRKLFEVPDGQGWPTNPKPSPDGHYLAYVLRTWESNVTMLENF